MSPIAIQKVIPAFELQVGDRFIPPPNFSAHEPLTITHIDARLVDEPKPGLNTVEYLKPKVYFTGIYSSQKTEHMFWIDATVLVAVL